MKSKTNRKKRTTKKSPPMGRFKTFATLLALCTICTFGLWRCLEEDASPLNPLDLTSVKNVDVGEGKTADPSLVNERELLKMPASKPTKIEKKKTKSKRQIEKEKQKRVQEEKEKAEKEKQKAEEEKQKAEEQKLERLFPMHAVAFHFHTQVRDAPSNDGKVVGYLRRGMTFKVGTKLSKKNGCAKGWYEISPGNLFVCSGMGVITSDEEVSFSPAPVNPNLDASMPYEYAYVTQNSIPQFWKIPSAEETTVVNELFERLSEENNDELKEEHDKKALAGVLAKAEAIANNDDKSPPPLENPTENIEEQKTQAENKDDDTDTEDPNALPAYVHMKMAKGYFVSTDGKVKSDKGDTYRSTVRGRYIEASKLAPAKPSNFEGVLLGSRTTLPFVYVVGGGVKTLRLEKEKGPLSTGKPVNRLSKLPYLGEMKRKNRKYIQVGQNEYLSSRVVAVVNKANPPEDLEPGERWIDINLSQQTLVAYEGETPVFATLIASGRKGFDTPEGEFHIYGKHVSITMDDTNAGDESYSIEDVPWTQYFEEGYALHTAFWHNRFGRVRSHGCINLAPSDAHRLFFWTGPHLPTGLHGIISTKENRGTRLVIHK